jgi:hypothetical protein
MAIPKIRKVLVDEKGNILEKRVTKLPEDVVRKPKAPKIYKAADLLAEAATPRVRVNKAALGPNGHWDFPEVLDSEKAFGFIYLIHDTIENKFYLGKKQFRGTGKLNKGEESNWKYYTSSCKELVASIKRNGKELFKFYVLEQYYKRGTLGYAETWSLCMVEALANRDKWHNGLINKVSWTITESITERHKKRLSDLTGVKL